MLENTLKCVQLVYLNVCPYHKSFMLFLRLLKQPTLQDGLAVLIFYLILPIPLFLDLNTFSHSTYFTLNAYIL